MLIAQESYAKQVYNPATAVMFLHNPELLKNKDRGGAMYYLLAKLAALGIAIWFYKTADEHGEPPFKWVVTGLIGYVIVWFLADFVFDSMTTNRLARGGALLFVVNQLPAFAGLAAAHFIRKKMLSNLAASKGGES